MQDPLPTTSSSRSTVSPIAEKRLAKRTGIHVFIFVSVILLFAYGTYHRIGTTAAIDEIVDTPRYAGGFLAIGTSDDRPGALILSEVERKHVGLFAQTSSNPVAGRVTRLTVEALGERKTFRLRSPLLIVIKENGNIETAHLNWSRQGLLDAFASASCSNADASQVRLRCGVPFVELASYLKQDDVPAIPDAGRQFLEQFTKTRGKINSNR